LRARGVSTGLLSAVRRESDKVSNCKQQLGDCPQLFARFEPPPPWSERLPTLETALRQLEILNPHTAASTALLPWRSVWRPVRASSARPFAEYNQSRHAMQRNTAAWYSVLRLENPVTDQTARIVRMLLLPEDSEQSRVNFAANRVSNLNFSEPRVVRVQDIVAFFRNDYTRHGKHRTTGAQYPIVANLLGRLGRWG